MLLVLLGRPASCPLNMQNSTSATDPAFLLWLLRASYRQKMQTHSGWVVLWELWEYGPCWVRFSVSRIWQRTDHQFLVVWLTACTFSFSLVIPCLCHFAQHFFLQSLPHWNPTSPAKPSSNAVFFGPAFPDQPAKFLQSLSMLSFLGTWPCQWSTYWLT